MRISIIIAIYKDIEALKLIINSLKNQNYPDLEVVIAEDNNDPNTAEYVASISGLDVIHTTQKDLGIRKSRSQNNAIIKSTGEYLIFIDGDCIPYSTFIKSHATLSEPGYVLSGRRVNLGPEISKKIRQGDITPCSIEKNFLLRSLQLLLDGSSHTTQGIYISPKNWLYRNILAKRKKSNLNILGCNFSCFKNDLITIDGFDEAYGETAVADDTDLQWRFEAAGLKLKTCKMAANQFHLDHSRHHQARDVASMVEKMYRRKKTGNYTAESGLSSHSDYPSTTEKPKTLKADNSDSYDCDVAVVLINYNSSRYTINCIGSILQNTSNNISYRIIVIDNASELNDYKNLVDNTLLKNSICRIFRSNINLGFSAGNMLGVQFANAKYYFFLNNDCHLQNDCINILYNFCENHTNTALCSPQLFNEDGKHQPCFGYFPYLITKILGVGILRLSYGKRFIKRKALYTEPVRVDVVSGSQMFVRAKVFNELGGFDNTYFLYCEEEDIALRTYRKGYDTYLIPEAKNCHEGGGSTVASLDIQKEFYISFLYFYRKNFGFVKQQVLKIILTLRLLRKGFTSIEKLKLCLFVASGAHFKHSIKHKQQIQKTYKI